MPNARMDCVQSFLHQLFLVSNHLLGLCPRSNLPKHPILVLLLVSTYFDPIDQSKCRLVWVSHCILLQMRSDLEDHLLIAQ